MKKISKIITHLVVLMLIISTSFIFTGCKEKAKYELGKYIDVAYGDHTRQKLDLYLPEGKTGEVGLILMIHGGSWVAGDKNGYAKDLNKWSSVYGYAAAAINYHYASNDFYYEDIMNDIAESLKRIKDIASLKHINIEKVMLTGGSAGGHLSLLYAYKYANTSPVKPVAVANYSGPTDLTDPSYYSTKESELDYLSLFSLLCNENFTSENYKTPEMQNKLLEASPINYINENTVPTLICHALEDTIVPYSNAARLKDKLNTFNVKYDLVTYENSNHGLGNDKKHSKESKKLFLEYAKTYLG